MVHGDGLSQFPHVSVAEPPSQPVPPCLGRGARGYRLPVISQGCAEVNAGEHLCGTQRVVRDSIYKLRQRKPKHQALKAFTAGVNIVTVLRHHPKFPLTSVDVLGAKGLQSLKLCSDRLRIP